MEKKHLIGVSILVMVLLVLGSLSNVVGYQSVKSTVNASPLFQTRTQRATNQQMNIFTSFYLGKGLKTHLQLPTIDNRTELIQKISRILNKMTPEELDQLYKKLISYHYENNIDKIAYDKALFFFSQIKSNNIDLRRYLINNNTMNKDPPSSFCVSIQYGILPCLFAIISFIAWVIGFQIFVFTGRLTIWVNTCAPLQKY